MQLKQKHLFYRMAQLKKTRWAQKIKKLSSKLEIEKKISYSVIQTLLKKAVKLDKN